MERSSTIMAIHSILFVARCATAATAAYLAADWLDLGHPVWAVVSALIVSQETARETRRSFIWRAFGTAVGGCVALTAVLFLMPDSACPLPAMAAAVTICAAVARRWPLLRVCLWTAPLIILTTSVENTILSTALQRGGEVLLGGLIGAAIHLLLDCATTRTAKNR